MRITQEADYALRIVCRLAQTDGRKVSAAEVSDSSAVSVRFTLKILHKLVNGGIVQSYKGVNGGYMLARPTGEITLRDVIELIDGPLAISKCIDEGHQCSREGTNKSDCILYQIFCRINDEMSGKLGRITIAAVADKNADPVKIMKSLI